MTPIIKYLDNGELPLDKVKARALKIRVVHYAYKFGQLYKRGYSTLLLKCVTPERGFYIMQEIHEDVCGNHSGPRSLLHKVTQQGYYWPNMVKDVEDYVWKCDACQRFSQITHQPAELLTLVLSLWTFVK